MSQREMIRDFQWKLERARRRARGLRPHEYGALHFQRVAEELGTMLGELYVSAAEFAAAEPPPPRPESSGGSQRGGGSGEGHGHRILYDWSEEEQKYKKRGQ